MDYNFTYERIFSLIALILSGYLGYLYGLKQSQHKLKMEFIQKQIEEFYSPMVGIIKDIKAKTKIRYKIEKSSDEQWRKLVNGISPREFESSTIVAGYRKAIMANIDYNNEQFRNYLFPEYKKMLLIFKDKIALAEPQTSKWFEKFNHFVEIWERYLQGLFPLEVIEQVRISEDELFPFYDELENRLDILRNKLKEGKPT